MDSGQMPPNSDEPAIPPITHTPLPTASPRPSAAAPAAAATTAPAPRRSVLRIIFTIFASIVMGSISAIMILLILVVVGGLVTLMAAASPDVTSRFQRQTIRAGDSDQVIAVIDIVGVIDDRAARRFATFTQEVSSDRNVKAVLMRVASPGGGVSASDQMHNMVTKLKASGKTVVVSMGNVAASGGYYISAGADKIFAEPTTITGSIGVFMTWPVAKGTLEKLGVEMVVIKSTHARGWKDEISYLKQPAVHHRKHLQGILDKMQEQFESVVRNGRGERLKTKPASYAVMPTANSAVIDHITEIEPFNGKVYMADKAMDLGLVDEIGYLGDAIAAAGNLAALPNAKVVRYSVRRGRLATLLEGRQNDTFGLNTKTLDELQTPRMMMMWKAR